MQAIHNKVTENSNKLQAIDTNAINEIKNKMQSIDNEHSSKLQAIDNKVTENSDFYFKGGGVDEKFDPHSETQTVIIQEC